MEKGYQVIKTTSWEDFLKKIEEFKTVNCEPSAPIFRGQGSNSWCLETTLERYLGDPSVDARNYDRWLVAIKPSLDIFSDRFKNLDDSILNEDETNSSRPLPPHEKLIYMAYLRHYGFPSPLLDWSDSVYIASFFAFDKKEFETDKKIKDDPYVAVYAYCEFPEGRQDGWVGVTIESIGSYIAVDSRHFHQQCRYTLCRKRDGNLNYTYVSHEKAFENGENLEHGLLIKYLIPKKERTKVLDFLDSVNINAYSLYGSQEALFETLAYREIRRENCNR
jgi:FRG domain